MGDWMIAALPCLIVVIVLGVLFCAIAYAATTENDND